jgi:hypothetical protein
MALETCQGQDEPRKTACVTHRTDTKAFPVKLFCLVSRAKKLFQKNPLFANLTSRGAALECVALSRGKLRQGNSVLPSGAAMRVLRETNFAGISPAARGKVRDIYDAGDKLLIVASDRLSAFDVVLPTGIPDKGRVLTQLSLFWFDLLRDVIPNHVISATDFPFPFDARWWCARRSDYRSNA